jgi:hypothetical protein
MRRSSLRNGWAARLLLQRVDRAAGNMTPYLIVLVIGLALLNLICLVRFAPHLSITRHPCGMPNAVVETDCIIPAADAALRTGS